MYNAIIKEGCIGLRVDDDDDDDNDAVLFFLKMR